MHKFILRRLLAVIPILIGITLVTFIILNVIPGSPLALMMDPKAGDLDPYAAQLIKAKWGLDQPLHVQYLRFLKNAIHGDLGYSYRFNQDVTKIVLQRLPATGKLAVAALTVSVTVGILAGVLSAVKHQTWIDSAAMAVALIGVSMPVFWSGLMLMYVFAVKLRWLPPSGYGDGAFRYLLMPAITLGFSMAGVIARLTRSSMLNVIRMEYVTTARSKGVSERGVIYRHAFRNAMIPVVTLVGVQTGALLSGAVVTETVFSWPGVGRLLIDSIMFRDLPVVQGSVILIALIFLTVNLAVDILYAYLDPRIRY